MSKGSTPGEYFRRRHLVKCIVVVASCCASWEAAAPSAFSITGHHASCFYASTQNCYLANVAASRERTTGEVPCSGNNLRSQEWLLPTCVFALACGLLVAGRTSHRSKRTLRAGRTATSRDTDMSEMGISFLGQENVPPLGIGLAALGRPGYINLGHGQDLETAAGTGVEEMCSHCGQVLDIALEKGIRYFDAARSYGKAEQFLGSWLKSRPPAAEMPLIGSKWGYYYTGDWQVCDNGDGFMNEVKEHTLSRLESQIGETMQNLGGAVKVYHIHSATLESGVLENTEVLTRMDRLRSEHGWRMGLSLSGPAQGITLEKALATGLFDCVQATFNLLEPSVGSTLLRAREAGLSVIVKEGVANGRLAPPGIGKLGDQQASRIIEVAKEMETSVDALALACVLTQPFRPMVLSGATTQQHLESNLDAVRVASQLDQALVQELMSATAEDPEQYWGMRGALAWN